MNDNLLRNKLHHYNTPGHCHFLTSSCYYRFSHFNAPVACQIFIEELEKSRKIYCFKLWAYVIMPNHVHLLIWPLNESNQIGRIESGIKGIMAKRYRKVLSEHFCTIPDNFLFKDQKGEHFIFWQKGGGFDRNLWEPKSIHNTIKYIEENPVKLGLVKSADEWEWSSAYARKHKKGLVPDIFTIPVQLSNPQSSTIFNLPVQ
jgi:putative transposase